MSQGIARRRSSSFLLFPIYSHPPLDHNINTRCGYIDDVVALMNFSTRVQLDGLVDLVGIATRWFGGLGGYSEI